MRGGAVALWPGARRLLAPPTTTMPPLAERPWVIATAAAIASAIIKLVGLTLRWEVVGWEHANLGVRS